jgi:hypothetical protein
MPIGSKASPMMTPETIPLRNINVIGSMIVPYCKRLDIPPSSLSLDSSNKG